MTENPYDNEVDSEIKLFCPKKLKYWGGWLSPLTAGPFLIFNWLKLKKPKEAVLAFLWVAAGVSFVISPPENSWIFIIGIIVYFELWKLFSCRRQLEYVEEKLFDCYGSYPVYSVIATGTIIIFSFFSYLTNTVGVPGYPNREFVKKYTHGTVKLHISSGFNEAYHKNFLSWVEKVNSLEDKSSGQWVNLRQVGDTVQERIVFRKEALENPNVLRSMKILAVKHSKEFFDGTPTEIHLCSQYFSTVKILRPDEQFEKHYYIQTDILKLVKLVTEDTQEGNSKFQAIFKKMQDSKKADEASILKPIEEIAALLKKNIELSNKCEFHTEEVKKLHQGFNSALLYQRDVIGEVLVEIVEGKSVDEMISKLAIIKEKFSKFGLDLSVFSTKFKKEFEKL